MSNTNQPIEVKGFQQFRLRGGVVLYARQDDRWQSHVVRAVAHAPLSADATAAALLPGLLLRGTRSYPSQARLGARLEELYGARLGFGVDKMGERLVFSASLWALSDRALPAGTSESALDEGLRLLAEAWFAPHLAHDADPTPESVFPADILEQERGQLRRRLQTL